MAGAMFLLQPPKLVGLGKGQRLVPGWIWVVSRLSWGGWLCLPRLENGSKHWMSRHAQRAFLKFLCPLALPSFSPNGLDLVAFRPFEDLPWFKGIPADQGQAVSSWREVSMASVDARHGRAPKPPLGLKASI